MGINERKGDRKDRGKKKAGREPELGYYLIVTDTEETEKNYFEGIRNSIPENLRDKLIIKVYEAKTIDLIDKCKDLNNKDPQYRIPWIVFDKDQVKNFDNIIKKAEDNDINVGWSNPCIEIWFLAYFGEMPSINESVLCCDKFKDKFKAISKKDYKKSEKNIYQYLNKYGDEEKAISIAENMHNSFINNFEKKPSKMCPSSTIYKLVKEIKFKASKASITGT